MNEYAMYLRKSRADMALESLNNLDTLENHEKILKKLALDQNLNVVKIYREVVSGESIDSRPEMIKLLNDVHAGLYAGVLVVEVERLTRGNALDQGRVEEAFTMTNTKIVTPMKTYDTAANEYDEEHFEFGLFMSRREYKTIRRRMSAGVDSATEKGYFLGNIAPYGYKKINPKGKIRTLEIVEDEAKYVRMIFDWFVDENATKGEITRRLTLMGAPTRSGNPEWDRKTVEGILSNPVYKGCVRWRQKKTIKVYENGKTVKKRVNNEEPKIVDGIHEAIVDKEKWEKAQKPTTHPKWALDKKPKNPLAHLLVCEECNRTLSYVIDRRYDKYRYTHKRKTLCSMPSSNADALFEAFIGALQAHIKDFSIKMNNQDELLQVNSHKAIVEAMESELQKSIKKREKLFDLFENDIYTQDEFVTRRQKLNEQIEQQERALEKEKANAPKVIDYKEKIIQFSQAIEMIQDDSISVKEKNTFLQSFIEKVTYSKEKKVKGAITLNIFLK